MASTAMRSTAMRTSTSARAAAPPAARRLSVAPRTIGGGLAARGSRPSLLSQAQAAEELGFKEMRKGVKVRAVVLLQFSLSLSL